MFVLLDLWDSLLKGRIELQKVVSVVNQLPQPDRWATFTQQGGDPYKEAVREGRSTWKLCTCFVLHIYIFLTIIKMSPLRFVLINVFSRTIFVLT